MNPKEMKLQPLPMLVMVLVTLAAAVSGKYDRFILYKNRLPGKKIRLEKSAFLEFIYCCMAMGFDEKWKENRTSKLFFVGSQKR